MLSSNFTSQSGVLEAPYVSKVSSLVSAQLLDLPLQLSPGDLIAIRPVQHPREPCFKTSDSQVPGIAAAPALSLPEDTPRGSEWHDHKVDKLSSSDKHVAKKTGSRPLREAMLQEATLRRVLEPSLRSNPQVSNHVHLHASMRTVNDHKTDSNHSCTVLHCLPRLQ